MLPVHTADISTPTPGSPTQDGIAVDTVPFCICISTSSGVAYLDVHDDASKKAWSAVLLRISQNGPQEANFSKQDMASTADFVFSARVSAYRVIDGKAYICNVIADDNLWKRHSMCTGRCATTATPWYSFRNKYTCRSGSFLVVAILRIHSPRELPFRSFLNSPTIASPQYDDDTQQPTDVRHKSTERVVVVVV
ncbi:hypothetical protein H257_00296 [Aphanomyces astaci]|uniref:WH2 domain-containing protein n=1 Tax=Aphanomyces astaci TaxID=112090 RepID=W4HB60_APHAT|nr:hypothetical protein H257_00296 [Aphanomyces astaci]ETV88801.1 hypothetical protein H257_00296 [Aphanomyces astaci]|eukprot:XP_009821201.1 hypothetical protein H257_00296 [Aphanomyces astaci]